jgi:transposase InsO family protein
MPFNTKTVMEQRLEFTMQATKSAISFSLLCHRYGISRVTGYKWLNRYQQQGLEGLLNQSRKPKRSPNRSPSLIEEYVISQRKENPEWGSKKIHSILKRKHLEGKWNDHIPARSTIHQILKRHGLISTSKSEQSESWTRFEHQYPNDLWQMDFKGYFPLQNQQLCHPLTILDDHSRFNLALTACLNQQYQTVKECLIKVFAQYGIPYSILADNGAPWGTAGNDTTCGERSYTHLEKWLIEQNIRIIHGRYYHPQTQGKEERFHRTLKAELLQYENFRDHHHCQNRFDWWREKYNCRRPHEGIDMQVPAQRYQPSKRAFKSVAEAPEYDLTDTVKRVNSSGCISLNNKQHKIGKAFIGDYVAVRPTIEENVFEVYFHFQPLRKISL